MPGPFDQATGCGLKVIEVEGTTESIGMQALF
jgi:hypothetical protein